MVNLLFKNEPQSSMKIPIQHCSVNQNGSGGGSGEGLSSEPVLFLRSRFIERKSGPTASSTLLQRKKPKLLSVVLDQTISICLTGMF